MKLRKFFIACLCVITLTPAVLHVCGAEVLDKVIVVVNDEVVTQREFDRLFFQVKKMLQTNFGGQELQNRVKEAEKNILEQLINSKLAISLAKKAKIEIDENTLQQRVDTIKSYYPNEQAFLQALNEKGTTLTEFEKELRDQMLAQELVQKEVGSKITVTPGEMRDLYAKNKDQLISRRAAKLRVITVTKKADDKEQGASKIQDILSRYRKGENFSELAKQYSEDGYASEGGEMGFLSPGETLKEIDEVVFNLNPGDVSDVVESQMGYHIFKVEEIREPRQLEFEEVGDFLRQQLHMKKFEKALVEWLENKRENAYISYK
jgi:parvulin-like peptidyl-prolyl isomerase